KPQGLFHHLFCVAQARQILERGNYTCQEVTRFGRHSGLCVGVLSYKIARPCQSISRCFVAAQQEGHHLVVNELVGYTGLALLGFQQDGQQVPWAGASGRSPPLALPNDAINNAAKGANGSAKPQVVWSRNPVRHQEGLGCDDDEGFKGSLEGIVQRVLL